MSAFSEIRRKLVSSIRRLWALPIIVSAFAIFFSIGFYIAEAKDARPIWFRNTAFEIYHFFAGAKEERTSASAKLFSHFSGKARHELNEGASTKSGQQSLEFMLDNDVRFMSTVKLEDLENLAFVTTAQNGQTTIVWFFDKRVFVRSFEEPFIDFDVKNNILIRLADYKLSGTNFCDDDELWIKNGAFHHYFTASSEHNLLAAFGMELSSEEIEREKKILGSRTFSDINHNISIYDLKTGDLRKNFDFYDIAKANIERFDPLVFDWLHRYRKEIKPGVFLASFDLWHPNDIEFAPANNGVEWLDTDDVIISAKAFNLLFIVSTENLEIKYYSQGLFQGQHDPDFGPDGIITVFNNRDEINGDGTVSSIDYINLIDGSHGEVVSGGVLGAITRHSGGHSIGQNAISMDVTLEGSHLIFDKVSKDFLGEVRFKEGDSFIPVSASKVIKNITFNSSCPAWREINF